MIRNSVFTTLGATNHTLEIRHADDFYVTDEQCVYDLLSIVPDLANNILEPSVGNGAIANVLTNSGRNVTGIDIKNRGYKNTIVMDFMDYYDKLINTDIVMNPPYKDACKHIMHGMDMLPDKGKLCALLKIQFLESKQRKILFDTYPLKYIYVYRARIKTYKNNDIDKYRNTTGAMCYAWYIWEKGYSGEPTVRWIDRGNN